jgi:hypothetical protein
MAIAARIPMMAMTIMSSIRVRPSLLLLSFCSMIDPPLKVLKKKELKIGLTNVSYR